MCGALGAPRRAGAPLLVGAALLWQTAAPRRHFTRTSARALAVLLLLAAARDRTRPGEEPGAELISAVLTHLLFLLAATLYRYNRVCPRESLLGALMIVGSLGALICWGAGGGAVALLTFIVDELRLNWRPFCWISAVGLVGGTLGVRWGLERSRVAEKRHKILARKFFHGIALLVALPAMWPGRSARFCALIWTAFVYLFALEELARAYNVLGLRAWLSGLLRYYGDERDQESLAVTPLALSLGCQLPMVYAAGSPACAVGILAATVGDSAAALVPNWLCSAPHECRGPSRTWEGLAGFALAHFAISALWLGSPHACGVAAAAAGLTETFAGSMDNCWVSVAATAAFEMRTRAGGACQAVLALG